jgi:hypothetical protein
MTLKQEARQYLTDLLDAERADMILSPMGLTLLSIVVFGTIAGILMIRSHNRKIEKYNETMRAYYSSPEYLAAKKAQQEKEAQEMETIQWILRRQMERNR